MTAVAKLRWIKLAHTAIWAMFAGAIVGIPIATAVGQLSWAWGLIGLVLMEVLILVLNHMRCPLTDLAACFTTDRADNFDIYLPLWLARNNKIVFGSLYGIGVAYCAWRTFASG